MGKVGQDAQKDGPLRVAWVAGRNTFQDFGRAFTPLAVGLMDEPIELTVLCPFGADRSLCPSSMTKVIYYKPGRWPLRNRNIAAVASQLSSLKIALLHALDFSAATVTAQLARAMGVRYVIGSLSLSDTRRRGSLAGRAEAVMPACQNIELGIIKRHVAPASKVHLVRPGLHQVKRASCFADPNHSAAVVAGCGLRRRSVLAALTSAFAELRKRNYDCVFALIGLGNQERRLRRYVRKLGLERYVTFADRESSSHLADIMSAADIYISPDADANIDLGSLIAMAAGVPVLAGRDKEDFIVDDLTALTFNPLSARQLADKIALLLDDHSKARSLAEAALTYTREHHSPAKMVSNTVEVYRRAMADGLA